MELRQLGYFRTVAALGSVSKAAIALHMTQPSLSRQIMSLEDELQVTLFERTSRGVVATPAGLGLQRHVDVLFAHLDQIPEVVSTANRGQQVARIGVPQGLPREWALELFRSIEASLPLVTVSLHEATTEEQRQLLQNGLIDLGLIHADASELESVQILDQQLGVAARPGSSLAEHNEVTFANLDGLRVMSHAAGEIMVEEGRWRAASVAAGVDTQWVFRRFAEHSELIALTSQVDAVLVTEASAVRHLPGWTWIPLQDRDAAGQELSIGTWLAWREPATPLVSSVISATTVAMPVKHRPSLS